MVIDFHTHTFPERIAEKALANMSATGNVKYYGNGTNKSLMDSMKKNNIDYSVILPVATSANQHTTINETAFKTNENTESTGLISFGSIHPDNKNYAEILQDLKNHNIKGIKLHPCFQGVYFDDIRYKRIIECACENNLIVVTHAGYDVSFPGGDFVTPNRILNVINDIHPDKLVLAHMGGWGCFDDVMSLIAGSNVYLDTSISMTPIEPVDSARPQFIPSPQLDAMKFVSLVNAHGYQKILFGSDSPWSEQGVALQLVRNSISDYMSDNIQTNDTNTEQILDDICFNNAAKLLNIN